MYIIYFMLYYIYKYIIYTFSYITITFLLTIFYNFYNIIIEIYKLY